MFDSIDVHELLTRLIIEIIFMIVRIFLKTTEISWKMIFFNKGELKIELNKGKLKKRFFTWVLNSVNLSESFLCYVETFYGWRRRQLRKVKLAWSMNEWMNPKKKVYTPSLISLLSFVISRSFQKNEWSLDQFNFHKRFHWDLNSISREFLQSPQQLSRNKLRILSRN